MTIENRFFEKQHWISEKLHEAIKKKKSDFIIDSYKAELDAIYQAYRDVRLRLHYQASPLQGQK